MPLTKVDASNIIDGVLPVANGGTGASTQAGAANAILPTQSGQSGKYLTTNGTNTSWGTIPAATPGGSTRQVQYNNAGSFGGDSGFVYDTSGNLGLGVTPSAWGGTSKAIQLPVGGIESRSNNLSFVNNAYFDGSTWRYTNSLIASLYGIASNGQFQWYTAPVGTAGNAISFTQAMTLDASGNLGIGTSSPTQALTVYRASQPVIRLQNSTTGVTSGAGLSLEIGGNDGYLWNYQNGFTAFGTNNTERMRINSSGALGFSGANYGSSGQVLTSNGSGSAPSWQTATVNGTARAWVMFQGNNTINAAFNVSSVSNPSTGFYTVNFTNALSTTPLVILGNATWDSTNNNRVALCGTYTNASNTVNQFQLKISNPNSDAVFTPVSVYAAVFR